MIYCVYSLPTLFAFFFSISSPENKQPQPNQPSPQQLSLKPLIRSPLSAESLVPPALCEVHPSLLGNIVSERQALLHGNNYHQEEPYSESKLAQEHADVSDMFSAMPHLIQPVLQVLKKYHCRKFPCRVANPSAFAQNIVRHYVNNPNEAYDDLDPFYVVDLGRVIVQMAKFRKNLPTVQPYYAVKCNPSDALLSMISALGGSFDCASYQEFKSAIEGNYATADRVIFANPCKSRSDLRHAEDMGVRFVTFDNFTELEKLAQYMPSCKAVLRIKTNDSAAVCAFSTKFGASMGDVSPLMERAAELGVQVVGVSFHVGSGNNDPNAYAGSILNARTVFNKGISLGFEMKLLDIGGGFPGTEPPLDAEGKPTCMSFEQICSHIRPLLEEHFSTATIIAEPGRYFSASTHLLAMNVHSMRKVPMPDGNIEYQYYVNDGLYHSFNCIVFDHAHPQLHLMNPDSESRLHVSTIFGPTCDSLDCILKRQLFPEMAVGEWLFVPDMGSYTTAAGAPFNGFATRRTEYMCSLPYDIQLPAGH